MHRKTDLYFRPLATFIVTVFCLIFHLQLVAKCCDMEIEDEPNPPVWPHSVKIFRETDNPDWIREQIRPTQDPWSDQHQSFTSEKHFSSERNVLLFFPGTYTELIFQVGYYVQVLGLGRTPDEVQFVRGGPYVPALNKHLHRRSNSILQEPVGTCLDTFWRSAENFRVTDHPLMWAVSQAAPLRRVRIQNGDIYLHDGEAYASGGHLANCDLQGGGKVYAGGQQQFLVRNVHLADGADGGAWSMVYAGCTGQVPMVNNMNPATTATTAQQSNGAKVTVLEEPNVRVEKPYIAVVSGNTDNERFVLRVPQALRRGDANYTNKPLLDGQLEDERDFSRVRVIRDTDPVDNIQIALDQGKDVVLTPGIFRLTRTVTLHHPGQVLLGLGLATLEAPRDGSPCIYVAPHVPGVRIAGIMLEATELDDSNGSSFDNIKTRSLLEWGNHTVPDAGLSDDPGVMMDVFIRVGGATTGDRTNIAVDCMLRLHSGHVIGDNLWIWRADHAALGPDEKPNYPHISPIFWQTEQNEFRAATGVEVTADDVSIFGLAVEHANGHQTVWSGERGFVVFYQCEFPYGVYRDFAAKEYSGYLIQDHVQSHQVHAPGIYSNFRNDAVYVTTAMTHPERPGVEVINPFIVKLDNQGGIISVANRRGGSVVGNNTGIPVFLCDFEKELLVASSTE